MWWRWHPVVFVLLPVAVVAGRLAGELAGPVVADLLCGEHLVRCVAPGSNAAAPLLTMVAVKAEVRIVVTGVPMVLAICYLMRRRASESPRLPAR